MIKEYKGDKLPDFEILIDDFPWLTVDKLDANISVRWKSQEYTTTNVTEDRTFDANTVAVAELADIVWTLIADLKTNRIIK